MNRRNPDFLASSKNNQPAYTTTAESHSWLRCCSVVLYCIVGGISPYLSLAFRLFSPDNGVDDAGGCLALALEGKDL